MVLGFMFYFVDKVGISATEEEVSTAVTGFSSNFQFQDGTYYTHQPWGLSKNYHLTLDTSLGDDFVLDSICKGLKHIQ